MIHWKNRPIDRLSREELQQALADAVRHSLSPATPASSIHDSFLLGLFTGAGLAVLGLAAAFLVL